MITYAILCGRDLERGAHVDLLRLGPHTHEVHHAHTCEIQNIHMVEQYSLVLCRELQRVSRSHLPGRLNTWMAWTGFSRGDTARAPGSVSHSRIGFHPVSNSWASRLEELLHLGAQGALCRCGRCFWCFWRRSSVVRHLVRSRQGRMAVWVTD